MPKQFDIGSLIWPDVSQGRRPSQATGPSAKFANRLKSLYNLAPGIWDLDQVTGRRLGQLSGLSSPQFSGGLLLTTNTSGVGYLLPHGLALVGAPFTIVIGHRLLAGNVTWSILNNAGDWTGVYSGGTEVVSTSSNSFDGSVATSEMNVAFSLSSAALRAASASGCGSDTALTMPSMNRAEIALGWSRKSVDDNPSSAVFSHFAALEGELSIAELCSLAEDPWQLFATPELPFSVPAASGSTYNVSATEAATATDSQATAMLFATTRTEAATAVETIAAALAAAAARTETATASEAATAALAIPAARTEAATASETAIALMQLAASLTETTTTTDLAVALLIAVATVAEAASASETSSTGPQYSVSITETATAADALQAAASLVAQVAEAAAAGDAYTCAAQLVALITEAATASDAAAGAAPASYSVSITELATALDTLVATLVHAGGPEVHAAISAARRAWLGRDAARPAQVSTTRRPRS